MQLKDFADYTKSTSQRLCQRIDSLASVVPNQTVAETLKRVSRRRKKNGVTLRALNVHREDQELLKIIGRGGILAERLSQSRCQSEVGG